MDIIIFKYIYSTFRYFVYAKLGYASIWVLHIMIYTYINIIICEYKYIKIYTYSMFYISYTRNLCRNSSSVYLHITIYTYINTIIYGYNNIQIYIYSTFRYFVCAKLGYVSIRGFTYILIYE